MSDVTSAIAMATDKDVQLTVAMLVSIWLLAAQTEASGECPFDRETLVATDTPQVLSSPPRPPRSVSFMNCFWMLEAVDPDLAVEVKVIALRLDKNSDCAKHFLAAYNGKTAARQLVKWCGSDATRVVSAGRYLTLQFQSDLSQDGEYFRLQYRQVPDVSKSATYCPSSDSPSISVNRTGVELVSPNYPNPYFRQVECLWSLRASNASNILHVRVLDSDLEDSSSCRSDYVIAYNGSRGLGQAVARWCGKERPVLYSSGPLLALLFHADSQRQGRGFRLKARAVTAEEIRLVPGFCPRAGLGMPAFPALNSTRQLASRNYPSSYPRNSNCVWVLRAVDDGFVVEIVVLDSRLEVSSNCHRDSVVAYDGNSTGSQTLGFWCGETTPSYTSSGRFLTLSFVSDGAGQEKGFLVSYRQMPAIRRRSHGISLSVSLPLVALILGIVLFVGCCVCKGRTNHNTNPPESSAREENPLTLDPLTQPLEGNGLSVERAGSEQSYSLLKNSPRPRKQNGYVEDGEFPDEQNGLRQSYLPPERSPQGSRYGSSQGHSPDPGNSLPEASPSSQRYSYEGASPSGAAQARSSHIQPLGPRFPQGSGQPFLAVVFPMKPPQTAGSEAQTGYPGNSPGAYRVPRFPSPAPKVINSSQPPERSATVAEVAPAPLTEEAPKP